MASPPPACTVCNHCRKFGNRPWFDDKLAISLATLERSAASCKYCAMLRVAFDETDINRVKSLYLTDATLGRTEGLTMHVIWNHDMLGGSKSLPTWDDVDVRNLMGKRLPNSCSRQGKAQSTRTDVNEEDRMRLCPPGCVNTGSNAAVKWAQDRISTCRESHRSCTIEGHGALPDRVLRLRPVNERGVGLEDASLEADVQLYESTGEKSVYATLSHRWGDLQPLCLKLDNIADFRQRIPWNSLPKTFQQAIMFARRLDIPYLWIDSLCIIQDSREDWLIQSGKMAAIYEHSEITIAATSAADAQEGCYVEPGLLHKGCVTDGTRKVPVTDGHEGVSTLLARASADHPVIYMKVVFKHALPQHFNDHNLPLLQRGWVYQERLLSPRLLHFGPIDLIWECNEKRHCFCGYADEPGVNGGRHYRSRPLKPQHAALLKADLPANSTAARWTNLIEEYTALNLTYDSDRLAAIAGVAKQMRRGLKNKRYMAGLFEDSLETGLTWQRADDTPTVARASVLGDAPSWSWLSVPGKITYPASRYIGGTPFFCPVVKKVEFHCKDDKEFVTLWGGSITLHGKVAIVKQRLLETTDGELQFGFIIPGTRGWYAIRMDHQHDDQEIKENWVHVSPRWMKKVALEPRSTLGQMYDLPADEDLDDKVTLSWGRVVTSARQLNKHSYCLYMGRRADDGALTDMYMLLERSSEKEHTYVRLGFGTCSVDDKFLEQVDKTQEVRII